MHALLSLVATLLASFGMASESGIAGAYGEEKGIRGP